MLRGRAAAKLDEKGRLKVPAAFRAYIEKTWGGALFITSLGRSAVLLYPLPVWQDIEEAIDRLPQSEPALQKFLDLVNYYGLEANIDAQGRVLIHPGVRDMLGEGELAILGKRRWLEVWNHDLLRGRLSALTDEDLRVLSGLGF